MGDVSHFKRAPDALKTLSLMRLKYDRGDYLRLAITAITHQGAVDEIEVLEPSAYGDAAIFISRHASPMGQLAAMRQRYDEGGYQLYIVTAMCRDGRLDRIRLYPPALMRNHKL